MWYTLTSERSVDKEYSMTIFCCPKCASAFQVEKKAYRCEKGHVYDRAASGYVNLLPPGGKQHGDSKEMLRARRDFLQSGAYAPLQNAICEKVKSLPFFESPVVLDAGCGEGYYTEAICKALPNASIFGVDVSKDAVKMCDALHMGADFAAASVYALPIREKVCDLVISVFSPFAGEEFQRVLKEGGYLISVIPDAKHLWQLKSILYENPYENKVADYETEGFTFVGAEKVSFTVDLDTNDKIMALFGMTPYCHRTGAQGRQRMEAVQSLKTEASFQILSYRK